MNLGDIMTNIFNTVKREEQASRHINILMHYDNDTLLDKNDKLIKIIKLSGIDCFTKDNLVLNSYKNNRNKKKIFRK
jgi:type IV secretory pathway VirB4 component